MVKIKGVKHVIFLTILLFSFTNILAGERQPIHGEKLPERGAENLDLMPDLDISQLTEEEKQALKMLGWSAEYLKGVAKQFAKDVKDVLRIESEAPAICKERRETCLSQCFTEDCKFHCYRAFYECARSFGVQ